MEVTKRELKQMYYDMVTIRYAVLVLQITHGLFFFYFYFLFFLKSSILMV